MNLEKEREAFEKVFTIDKGWDLTFVNETYQNQNTNNAYAGWKASSNRKGYKLVPATANKKMLKAGYDAHNDFFFDGQVQDVYKAMIGVVE